MWIYIREDEELEDDGGVPSTPIVERKYYNSGWPSKASLPSSSNTTCPESRGREGCPNFKVVIPRYGQFS